MRRREFVGSAAAAMAASAAAAEKKLDAALLTQEDGPHLGSYLEALADTPEVASVALCEATGKTEAAARKALGPKLTGVYRDASALFAARRPGLGFALVTMEGKLAPPVIEAALDAGCHVLAEKPACVRAEDFAPLAAKAEARRLNLMLALANRTDPVMEEARRVVQSGRIGKVYGVELYTIADQTRLTKPEYHRTWTAQKARSGGGHLIWLGIHWLDLAMFITGSTISEVAGFAGNVGGQPIDTEDSAALALRFSNGTFGTLTSGYYLDRGKHLTVKIWGSGGWLELRHGTSNPLEWQAGSGPLQRYTMPAGEPAAYTKYVRHAARSAMGLEPPVLSPAESLRALRVVFAGYRAAETGRTQRVEN